MNFQRGSGLVPGSLFLGKLLMDADYRKGIDNRLFNLASNG
jgi:hypothetical protein